MPACGTCTMCCKLMGIPELKKKPTKWCGHCDIGHGCKIYEERPTSCHEFECYYRMVPNLPISMRPDKAKVLIAPTTNSRVISVHCDPGYPDAWQKEPFYSHLKAIVEDGTVAVVSNSLGTKKIALRRTGPGIISKQTIEMSEPDENGMQWYTHKEETA